MMRAIWIGALFVIGASAAAVPLSDAGYLRKLSYHLRGTKPVAAEYGELSRAQFERKTDEFFARKAQEYAASPQAADRMAFRLSERFQIQTPTVAPELYRTDSSIRASLSYSRAGFGDALTDLFGRLVRDNLSWDTLLTGKRYTAHRFGRDDASDDFAFLSVVKPEMPLPSENDDDSSFTASAEFDANDPRVAGALTTARFVNRYATTNVNKNRRRAAAVFRIFLCDPMFPVIPPPPDRKGAALAQAFADQVHESVPAVDGHAHVTEKQLLDAFTINDEQRHGSDKRCVACHYKLDPMGKTFQAFGVALGPSPTPGGLRFAGIGGRAVNERLRGIGDLGTKLVRQPEYVRCQVNWFWKQFIGADVSLTPERLEDLSAKFEAVGRRTNDFVKVLVTSPEFRERPQADDRVTFARISPYLQRCDSCHAATNDLPMFLGWQYSAGHPRQNALPGEFTRRRIPDVCHSIGQAGIRRN